MYQLEVQDFDIFERVPERLGQEFLQSVECFYMRQALDRPNNRGAIFVVNTNGVSLLRESNAMDNAAFDAFSRDWMKVVIFEMFVSPYASEPDVLFERNTLQKTVDALAIQSFEDIHFDQLINDISPEQMSDALHTFAGDICTALRVLRLPFVAIDDPVCIEHNSFSFVMNMHVSGHETFYAPLYYIYPRMKMFVSQREVW